MSKTDNIHPALARFVSQLGSGRVFGQVLIARQEQGYELRHGEEALRTAAELRLLRLEDLRATAQTTAGGAFRPLKAAPNLRKGWRFVAPDEAGLESALDRLYPGAMADWGAAESGHPPVTHYRAFTNRQTGLYRVTQALTEEQAAQVIRAGCHVRFCLKRRWWTVEGLAPDAAGEKSLIPCLEPCAVLLELARQAFRIEQAERVPWNVPGEDLATVRAALVVALAHPDLSIREGDVGAPGHPRRIQLALEKLAALETSGGDAEGKAPSK